MFVLRTITFLSSVVPRELFSTAEHMERVVSRSLCVCGVLLLLLVVGCWAEAEGHDESLIVPLETMCGAGEKAVQSPRLIRAGGCGWAGRAVLEMLEPGYDYTYCCTQFDACYGICGTTLGRCQSLFYNCLMKYCEGAGEREDCREGALALVSMGAEIGQEPFDKQQHAACDCVPNDDVVPYFFIHLARVFSRIMRFVAPEAIESEALFVAQRFLNDTRDAPELLLGTLALHPEAIKKRKSKKKPDKDDD